MIAEAREIRENQTFRSNAIACVVTSTEPKDQNSVVNILYYILFVVLIKFTYCFNYFR